MADTEEVRLSSGAERYDPGDVLESEENQRATTKGQNRFGTFSHFSHFSTLFKTFSDFFPQDFS